MGSPVTKKTPYPVMEAESLVIGFFLVAILVWSMAEGIVFQFAGEGNTVHSPDDRSTFEIGESISFSALFERGTPPYTVRLYIARDRPPSSTGAMYVKSGVMSNRPLTYTWDTTDQEEGTYQWQFIATDAHSVQYPTPVYTFDLQHRASTPNAVSGGDSSEREGSVSGGKGGHYSDRKGEKTGFFFTLFPGQRVRVSFANRTPIHRIRDLTITAIDELPGGNTFLIHQEFEPYFTNHPLTGYDEALAETEEEPVHPFFTVLPEDAIPYKAIHIHLTQDTKWEGLHYSTAVEFEIPSSWLASHGFTKENVVVQVYDEKTHAWVWQNVYWVKDEESVHIYRVHLKGIPPFSIGASPESFYGARITPVE